MANLVNLETNTYEEVDDNLVDESIKSGTHGFDINSEVPVIEIGSGQSGTLPPSDAVAEILNGTYSYISEEERVQRKLQDKYGGTGSKVIGSAESVARGLTVGLSDLALKGVGVPVEDIKGREGVLGGLGTALEVAGTMAPFANPAGKLGIFSKLGAPVRVIDKLGKGFDPVARAIINDRVKNKMVKKAIELGGRGSIEGGLFAGADYLKETSLGDQEWVAESFLNNVGEGSLYGLAGGSIIGASSEKAIRAGSKLKKSVEKSIKKIGGVSDSEDGLRLFTKGGDLETRPLSSDVGGKGAEFNLDQETGFYKYEDSTKKVYLDQTKLSGGILDITSPDQLNELGARIGIPKLSTRMEKFDPSKKGFRQFLVEEKLAVNKEQILNNSAEMQINDIQKKGIIKRINSNSERQNKLLQQIADLEAGKQTTASRKKISALTKKFRYRKNNSIELRKKYNQLSDLLKEGEPSNVTKLVDSALGDYNSIKSGTRLVVKNLDSIDSAIHRSISKKSVASARDKLSFGQMKSLKLISSTGELGSFLNKKPIKYQKEMAEFIRNNMRSDVNNKLINHPAFSTLDDFLENIQVRNAESLDEMTSAINQIENIMEKNGLKSSLTGEDIAESIIEKNYRPLLDKASGKPFPGLESIADDVLKYAESWRNLRITETGTQIPFSVRDFRNARIRLDKFPGLKHDTQQTISKELIKDARGFMENSLISQMKKFDDAGDFVKRYEQGKKKFALSTDAEKMVRKETNRQGKNNQLGLTSYMSGFAGASVGGVPGALAGVAVREFSRSYGENLLALYADKVMKSGDAFSNTITKSVKGFLKSTPDSFFTASIKGASTKTVEERYKDEIKRIENGVYDPQVFSENFVSNNQGLISALPNASNSLQQKMQASYAMLLEKVPKNPYQGAYIREYIPSDSQMMKFLRYQQAIMKPKTIFKALENGSVNNEQIEVLKRVYPVAFSVIQMEMLEEVAKGKKNEIGFKKRSQISKVFGIKTDHYQSKENVILLQAMIKNSRQEEEVKPLKQKKGDSSRSEKSETAGQRMMR